MNSTTSPTPTPSGRRGATGERRDWFRFDRADQWSFGLLLALGVVATVVVRLVAPVVGWAQGDRLRVPFFSEVEVPGLTAAGIRHSEADYSLLLSDPSTRQRLLDLAPGVGYALLAAVIAWLLLRVMLTIGRGEPFDPANVRRLRALALVLMVGWTVVSFAEATCTFAILADVDLKAAGVDGGPRAALAFPVMPFVVGLATAMVAEAFKAGARLQDDVEGLV